MTKKIKQPTRSSVEQISGKATQWIGTPQSILVHTLLFVGIFSLEIFGFELDQILLILTTIVSLEAIYLAIFIQMTVNRNTQSLQEVEADIDEIQEDVEDLGEEFEDISEDIEEIQAEEDADNLDDAKTAAKLEQIEGKLQILLKDIESLKKNPS